MRYWFDENDEERRRRSAFDEGMAFLVPIETNLQEAVQHFHLLESDGIQQSWEQVDFERDILEDVYGVSQSPPDIVGTHALYTFCGIDCRDYDGPQMWILMPIRLWEHDQTLFHSVNCGGCRGTYLFELRRRGEKEKADFVEMIWLETVRRNQRQLWRCPHRNTCSLRPNLSSMWPISR